MPLTQSSIQSAFETDLHSHQPIVYQHLLCKEVGADCGLITRAELLIDLVYGI